VEYPVPGARLDDIDRLVARRAGSATQLRRTFRESIVMTNPAEQRDRAGRASPYPKEHQ
jgi:hypothetical protein